LPYDRGHEFANWENPGGTHDEAAAATAWARTLDLFRTCL
jgi:dienelactone hydrolase